MSFDGFVRVTNNSGEEYEDAQVRLVVGTINLVEKIAQLAQIPMNEVQRLADENAAIVRNGRRHGDDGPQRFGGAMRGRLELPPAEKEIIKEGLSEYFIYTDRRDRNDPQRLVEADAQLRRADRAVQDPISLSPAGIRRPARADVSADEQQGIEARHHAAARRRRAASSATTAATGFRTSRSNRSNTSRSATRSS